MTDPQANYGVPFGGYYRAGTPPPEDSELTHVGPGMPCGEYLRRFWHPVAMSSEVGDLPLAVRILGEDLVLFRDKSGRVGLLHRHCSHRGVSLEFGLPAKRGIRCCYHGWLFDIDGTILETPGEPKGSTLKEGRSHGAYPALEYEGLVFAYFGPGKKKPEFPIYDTLELPANRLLPYAIRQPCNWLQIFENTVDPIHAVFLHTRVSTVQLTDAWAEMPIVEFEEIDGGIFHVVTRRVGDMVWVRVVESLLPNFNQTGAIWVEAKEEQYFSRVSLSKWIVPIDDTNSWTFGWRHFNDSVDPQHRGNEAEVGRNKVDFVGQTGDRPYEERQRNPGDWDAQVAQRPIAIRALEYLGHTDTGVVKLRKMLQRAIRGRRPLSARHAGGNGHPRPTYSGDTVMHLPKRAGVDDREFLRATGRRVKEIILASDRFQGPGRHAYIKEQLTKIG